jgi:hypothetical protein
MHNPRIGQLAEMLLRMEESGKATTPRYREVRDIYLDLKSKPENWVDVMPSERTPEQARLAAEFERSK